MPADDPTSQQEPASSAAVAQAKAEFLTTLIESSLKELQRKKRKNRQRASIIKVATILFSGIATILLGLQIAGLEKSFKDIAFTLGAIVTLLNALEPFFNYRALWIEHELALANLHRLQDDTAFYLTGIKPEQLSAEKLQELMDRYKDVWGNLSQNWIRYRKGEAG